MNKIKRRMDTKAAREFWASFDEDVRLLDDDDEISVLPYLGDSWWKAEKELSSSLLNIKDE